MASQNTIPATVNLVMQYSENFSLPSLQAFKMVIKNADGTIKDCTAVTSVPYYYQVPTIHNPAAVANNSFSTVSGDATGLTVTPTEAESNALAGNLTQNSSKITLEWSDGTDVGLAGVGTIILNVNP
jgi:hypothetical protein